MKLLLVVALLLFVPSLAHAEFRAAADMAKECRIALDVLQNHVEKSTENMLMTGECIGYVQAAADAALVLKDNVTWYKICLPEKASTFELVQKFIAFVDKNPKYKLANTAFQVMLAEQYACKNDKAK